MLLTCLIPSRRRSSAAASGEPILPKPLEASHCDRRRVGVKPQPKHFSAHSPQTQLTNAQKTFQLTTQLDAHPGARPDNCAPPTEINKRNRINPVATSPNHTRCAQLPV